MNLISGLFQKILKVGQFFLTRSCPICFSPSKNSVCLKCESQIIRVNHQVCNQCGQPCGPPQSSTCSQCQKISPAFDWHRSAASYEGVMTDLIHQYKYGGKLFLASYFTDMMMKVHGDKIKNCDFVIPVPLSRDRLKKRTYNQSLEIAKILADQYQLTIIQDSLIKLQDTVPQASLGLPERQKNLNKAFFWQGGGNIINKKILLVDDVYTTGSTLHACARVLKEAGAASVGCVTVAMTLKVW